MIHCTNQQLTRPDLQSHIYSRALLDNVAALRSLCKPATKFCAVVKANAYGHGITEIVNILRHADVDLFAVASIYEALHIQPIIGGKPVLILEPIVPNDVPENLLVRPRFNFHSVIASFEAMEFVASLLAETDDILNLHVNVETGMSRCGIDAHCAAQLIDRIESCPNTRLAGVYTHFATADEEDMSYAYEQLDNFTRFLNDNDLGNRRDIIVHCANSAATIKMPESHFGMVRCGISMYGYYSRPIVDPPIRLQPVMKLQAPIVQLKSIPSGRSVSYGRSYTTSRDTVAAIIPLGYADGYRRCFSNKAKMKIGDVVVGVIGRVCMDQLIVDVTDAPDVNIGAMVTVIDDDYNSPCGVYALADLAGTICYEILTCIHPHVKRVVHY